LIEIYDLGSTGGSTIPTPKRFRFTRDKLSAIPPSPQRKYFYDEGQSGLVLDVSRDTKSFRVYKKFRGRPVKITLGHFDESIPDKREIPKGTKPIDLLGHLPALNVAMARKLAVAVIGELDVGVNPTESRSRSGLRLGDLFDRYKTHLEQEGKKTLTGTTWYWERYLGKLPDRPRKKHARERAKAPGAVNWENRSVSEITREEVGRLRFNLSEKVGRTTANRVIELLRAIFNFGKREKLYAGENPAESAGKFQLKTRERFLRPDEAKRFFAALSEETDQDFADYVLLSLYTGARRGNILKMRAEELSLDGAQWSVAGEKMKNGEPLTIPLVSEAVEILKRRTESLNGEGWVFPGDTPDGHRGPFRAQWERFTKEAKLHGLRIHDLRRSLGSWMVAAGASTAVTMRALGHKNVNAALIYQRLVIEPVRAAMQDAVSALAKAAKGAD
jgi:integrase